MKGDLCRWERQQYCLDAESFRPASGSQRADDSTGESGRETTGTGGSGQTISLGNITTVKRCLDPSLPPGATIWVGLADKPEGAFFTAGGRLFVCDVSWCCVYSDLAVQECCCLALTQVQTFT